MFLVAKIEIVDVRKIQFIYGEGGVKYRLAFTGISPSHQAAAQPSKIVFNVGKFLSGKV